MPELDEAVQAIVAEHSTELIAKSLQTYGREIWQVAFNEGHNSGARKSEALYEDAKGSLATTTADLEKATTRMKEMEDNQPDLAAIRDQHRTEITEIKDGFKADLADRDQKVMDERLRNARTDLASKLEHECGIDPDYAREVLVAKDEVKRRLRFAEDGSLLVLQLGRDIEIQPTDEKSAISILAEEVAKGVSPKWVTSKADRGSEMGRDRSRTGSKAELFQGIRDRAKAKREEAGQAKDRRTALMERTGRI